MKKRLKKLVFPIGITCCFFLNSCKQNPETFAIHRPISPNNTDVVTYTLNHITGNVDEVKLFHTVSDINNSGTVTTVGTETELQAWTSPSFPLNFNGPNGGYGTNKLVQYRFQIKGNGKTYNHRITFATRPYPVSDAAIPVYVVGNQDKVLNIVFIPDTSMNSRMNVFRESVASQIDETFHREDWVRRFRSSYNFFINPQTAIARDFDTGQPHQLPSNSANLTFAQARAIIHFHDIRDQAGSGYFSAEYYVRGTMLHESGHALYRLADEYDNNNPSHRQTDPFPNNWDNRSDAEAAAPSYYGKTVGDVKEMGTSDWFRICADTCPMRLSGTPLRHYDEPCKMRIFQVLMDRANP